MNNIVQLFPSPISREELAAQLAELRAMLDDLDAREPENMDSEEYEQWGDAHEELEDQIDEILDLLDGDE